MFLQEVALIDNARFGTKMEAGDKAGWSHEVGTWGDGGIRRGTNSGPTMGHHALMVDVFY